MLHVLLTKGFAMCFNPTLSIIHCPVYSKTKATYICLRGRKPYPTYPTSSNASPYQSALWNCFEFGVLFFLALSSPVTPKGPAAGAEGTGAHGLSFCRVHFWDIACWDGEKQPEFLRLEAASPGDSEKTLWIISAYSIM